MLYARFEDAWSSAADGGRLDMSSTTRSSNSKLGRTRARYCSEEKSSSCPVAEVVVPVVETRIEVGVFSPSLDRDSGIPSEDLP